MVDYISFGKLAPSAMFAQHEPDIPDKNLSVSLMDIKPGK